MKYLGLVLVVLMLSGFGLPSCATTKGHIVLQINEAGNIYEADYWSKGAVMDFKVKGDSIEVKSRESNKESFPVKVVKEGYEVVKSAVATNKHEEITRKADPID